MSRVRTPLPAPESGQDHPGCIIPGFLLWLQFEESQSRVNDQEAQMDRDLIPSLWNMIEPVLEPEGIELVDIEFKLEGGRWVLRLYIDTPQGVTLGDCELASRQIGALLDIKDPIEHRYVLEVSSPGINRVLRKEEDFRLFAGSPVRLRTRRKLAGRRNFQGILKGMEDSAIILEVEGARVEIDPNNVEKANLDLSEDDLFRRDLRKRAVGAGD